MTYACGRKWGIDVRQYVIDTRVKQKYCWPDISTPLFDVHMSRASAQLSHTALNTLKGYKYYQHYTRKHDFYLTTMKMPQRILSISLECARAVKYQTCVK